MITLVALKTVIRCMDYEKSRDFYTDVLGLRVEEEWNEPEGRGCVMRIGDALLEFYEMTEADPRFRPEFRKKITTDKIDIQIKTVSVDDWAKRLRGVWDFHGPKKLPWGQKWIQMRDPDGLLIAIYEDAEER